MVELVLEKQMECCTEDCIPAQEAEVITNKCPTTPNLFMNQTKVPVQLVRDTNEKQLHYASFYNGDRM